MKLVVAHYHLRPGGVRRVIEEGTRAIVDHGRPGISEIILVAGERPDPAWREVFQRAVRETRVRYFIHPSFGYFSEQRTSPARIQSEARRAVGKLFAGLDGDCAVWFHNAGLGRNLFFVRELQRACVAANVPFISHHHDWWFDNRWQRWPEFKRCGFRTLDAVAKVIFPSAGHVGHAAINSTDATMLANHCGAPVGWIPNPAAPSRPVPPAQIREARVWLREKLGSDAPVWILPCRMLRRKNVAAALLLTRWLRPDAKLVTTGGVSSADEKQYFDKVASAARQHRWPLRLAIMRGDERRKPSMSALLAASEAVLLTSIQEGFGLPYIEAASSHRPIIARRLPNIAPDLAKFGFHFPYLYEEILVRPELFDVNAEIARQHRILATWEDRLPSSVRRGARSLFLLKGNSAGPVPFSRLTLTAQLEVLSHPPGESWALCSPLNPFLYRWRRDAMRGALRIAPWPRTADRWLGPEAYASHFSDLCTAVRERRRDHPRDFEAQHAFIRDRLDEASLFPLLLSPDT